VSAIRRQAPAGDFRLALSYLESAKQHRAAGAFDTANFFSNLARSVGNGYPPAPAGERLFRGHTEPSQSYMSPEQLRARRARAYGEVQS
jgi:hypothetical protein